MGEKSLNKKQGKIFIQQILTLLLYIQKSLIIHGENSKEYIFNQCVYMT